MDHYKDSKESNPHDYSRRRNGNRESINMTKLILDNSGLAQNRTFTFPELRHQLNKQGNRDVTDEQIQCCIDVLEFEGFIKRLSKDLWIRTDKKGPCRGGGQQQ